MRTIEEMMKIMEGRQIQEQEVFDVTIDKLSNEQLGIELQKALEYSTEWETKLLDEVLERLYPNYSMSRELAKIVNIYSSYLKGKDYLAIQVHLNQVQTLLMRSVSEMSDKEIALHLKKAWLFETSCLDIFVKETQKRLYINS